jgi:ABC-type nitrate/sulfonate/bicarbonate transport system ATPase subunit
MTSTAALSAHAIRKNFGRKHVLEGVDLEVAQGEVVALVGENGAGKTTLLRICAGVLPADGGSVELAGHAGYCPQDPGVLDLLTADEHLVYFGTGLRLHRQAALDLGRRFLARLDFPDRERSTLARDLSRGRVRISTSPSLCSATRRSSCSMSRIRASTEGRTSTSGRSWASGAPRVGRSSSSPICWPSFAASIE